MDNRDEVREFLTTRRERLTPEQAGVPFFGGKRRVKGLRREEVAMLAGMSTDYYTRLERRRSANRVAVRQGVQRILDTIHAPAYARNGRMDILATNRLGRALFADSYGIGAAFNLARYLFLDARSQDFYRDWETVARDCVAALRTEAGRNPYDRGLTDLIGEISTRSEAFRKWWATHDVKLHYTATKTMHHAVVGDLELTGEALHLPGDPGLTIITYTFAPSSPTEQALAFLASWSTREAAADTTE